MTEPVHADADEVLAGLDPDQRAAAGAPPGPVCILAGAGTGKTRTITHRIAYGVRAGWWRPSHLLAVTFTVRAAGEMGGRLRALGIDGVSCRTFHAAALRQARYFWPRVYGRDLPRVLEGKLQLVAEAARRCGLAADLATRRDLAAEIEWAKVSNVGPDTYAERAATARREVAGVEAAAVAKAFAAYEEIRRARDRIDFEDVLLAAAVLLAEQPRVAAAVRDQYRHFVVDEYQDVSPIQQALLAGWLGGRDDVCVVGDANQTIYSFAGATPGYLLGFPRRYPGATLVRLERDYRSTPQVVAVANAVLRQAEVPAAAALTLQAQQPAGPPVAFAEHLDEPAEAAATAAAIRRLAAAGVPLGEIAVLFRVNAQSEVYEQALGALGIGYVVRGAERFFDRAAVREARTLLRAAAHTGEPASGDLPSDVAEVLAAAGWAAAPSAGTGAARERWESLAAILQLARELAAEQPDADVAAFAAHLEERAAVQHAPAPDGVTLATLHAAKGLEWDAVFLVGLVDGTLPYSHAQTAEELAEERRLLYVGITRARRHLSCSWALARSAGGRPTREPSRFLHGVRPAVTVGSDAASSGRAGRRGRRAGGRAGRTPRPVRCRVCGRPLADAASRKLGRCVGCAGSADAALFERLRGWRRAQAEAQQVPAYCVFTDATLTAIAEARPGSSAELARLPGIGTVKLDRYGAEIVALCAGAEPPEQMPEQVSSESGK